MAPIGCRSWRAKRPECCTSCAALHARPNRSLRELDPRIQIRKQIREALAELDAEERAALVQSEQQTLVDGAIPPYDVEAT